MQLRDAGVQAQILVFGALSTSDLGGVIDKRLTPTVSSPSAATALQAIAVQRGVRLRCHLKIDTGMNRFGFRHDNLASTVSSVLASRNLAFDAVYTHFATAECPAGALYGAQCERFTDALNTLSRLGLRNVARHTANSAALLRDRTCWYDAVRPGLLLYGVVPPEVSLPAGLEVRSVMSLRSRVVAVKGMHVGETSGYGAEFTARRPTRVAIVPAGYADGLDVRLPGAGTRLDSRKAGSDRRFGLYGFDYSRRNRRRCKSRGRGHDDRQSGHRWDRCGRGGGVGSGRYRMRCCAGLGAESSVCIRR